MIGDRSVSTQERPRDLTEENIRKSQVGDVLRDAKIKGLELRHKATKKAFYFYYRTKMGIDRRPKLGNYGNITLSQARRMAQEMSEQVGVGRDPSKLAKDARGEKTLVDLWDEWRKRKGLEKKSAAEDKRLWEKKCHALAKKRLSEITYEAIADLHESVSEDAPISANRTLALLRAMFNFAVAPLGWVEKNPCIGVDANREIKRRRYMTLEEARLIAAELDAKEASHPAGVAFLRLLILTGARRGEIAKARWSQVQGNRIVLGEHKTDVSGEPRIIFLSPAAKGVLDSLPQTGGTITGIESPRTLWETIRKNAGCPGLRIHDLRHSFASVAISAGYRLEQIGELLGHRNAATTKRYAHLVDEAASAAVGAIGLKIEDRMTAAPPQLPDGAPAPAASSRRRKPTSGSAQPRRPNRSR